jgi:hypothetical protein
MLNVAICLLFVPNGIYAERHYAECRYAECRYAEFLGASIAATTFRRMTLSRSYFLNSSEVGYTKLIKNN